VRQIDASACISYLTIEHRGPVDARFRPALGNRVYGCDDCLAVCPWNKFAQSSREIAFHERETLKDLRLDAMAALSDAEFRALFAKSPVKRIGRDRFVRNILYAIGCSDDPSLLTAARARLDDADPAVADAASWAVSRLSKG
jgi:epoxyqueuosine reductase